MANIVITTVDANHIKVEFNDYYTNGVVSQKVGWYRRADINIVLEFESNISVHVIDAAQDWQVSNVEDLDEGILEIDDINGTTTWASLTVLGAQISALMVS